METLLTVMGWASLAILAWMTYGYVRNVVRSRQKPKTRTDSVNKELY